MLLSESDYTHSVDLLDHLFVIERGVVEARPAGPMRSDARRRGRTLMKTRAAVLQAIGRPQPYAEEPPAGGRGARARPARPGRGPGRDQGRRAVPFGSLGDQRRSPAPDADGAGPRGGRDRARARPGRERPRPGRSRRAGLRAELRPLRGPAWRAGRRCASRAPRPTSPATCSRAPGSCAGRTARCTTTWASRHLPSSPWSRATPASGSTRSCRSRRRRCSAARCSPGWAPWSTPPASCPASRSRSSASAGSA